MMLRTSLADALQDVFSNSFYIMSLPGRIDYLIVCIRFLLIRLKAMSLISLYNVGNSFVQHNAFVLYSLY